MNNPDIYKMLYDRAYADTGTGGLFSNQMGESALVTGWFSALAPTNQTFPYCVASIASKTPEDGFAVDLLRVRWRVSVFSLVRNGLASPSGVLRRIYGDWSASGSQTYGFHRWLPSMTSSDGWAASAMRFISEFEQHDEDVYQHGQEYEFYLSRTNP